MLFHYRSHYSKLSFIYTFIIILGVIIVYELLHLLNVPNSLIQSSLGFALLFAILFSSFRFGLWPAIMAASIANVYLVYAYSGPGRTIVPLENMVHGEWVIALLFFLPASIIGYLRDKINGLIQKERLARQEAEEGKRQLEKVIEEMPVGIVIAKAPSGEVLYSNRHLDQIMGHTITKHQHIDAYPKNMIIDSQGNPLPEKQWPLIRVIQKAETIVNEDFIYQIDSGTQLRLQVKGAPIFAPDGRVASGVVIIDDVTAEKELVQRKDDFLSMISHELKTPITSLKMYTQLLMKQITSSADYDPMNELQKIDNQVQKIHTIINNMMDLATLQLNKNIYQRDLVSMVEIIREVIQEITNAHPKRQIIAEELKNAPIVGDKNRLSQVITNIITNAIKYSPEDQPIIITSTVMDDSVQISVQDFGMGISPREKHKVFERFYQGSQKNGRIYPGLGIGLYFSKEIIEHHNGKIWVDSKKGQGSTFYITFPLAEHKKVQAA